MEEQDIKEKILNGTEALFMKYGVRSVSMDDIARHLGVSKKTLYQHFADKDELVLLVSKAHMERETKEYDGFRAESSDAIDELAKIAVCIRQNMQKMNPSLLFELQKYHPKAWEVWLQFKENYIRESVVRNLKQGIDEGYFRDEVNANILASCRIAMIEAAFDERLFPKERYDLAEVQSQLFDHFVNGLLTDKGRKLYLRYKDKEVNQTKTVSI